MRIPIIICLFLLTSKVCCQQLDANFRYFDIDDGLPSNMVNCVMMDSKGFIWMGTADGLSRFDGLSFQNYIEVGQDSLSLSGASVLDIKEDQDGCIWLGTEVGTIDCFDPKREIFTHYDLDVLLPDIGRTEVKKMLIDESGSLWLATYANGLIRFNPDKKEMQQFLPEEIRGKTFRERRRNTFFDLIQDQTKPELLWIAGRSGLFRFDRQTNTLSKIPQPEENLKPLQKQFNQHYTAIIQMTDNELWLGSKGGGLARYRIKEQQWERYYESPAFFEQQSEAYNQVLDLMKKSEEDIWICDLTKGFGAFHIPSGTFQFFEHNPIEQHTIGASQAFMVEQTGSDLIWVSHPKQKGISLLDPGLNQFKELVVKGLSKEDLFEDQASAFHYDTVSKQLYVSYWGADHCLVFDQNMQLVERISQSGKEDVESNYSHLIMDQHRNTWARVGRHLGRYNPVSKQFELQEQEKLGALPYDGRDLTEIFESSTKTLWLGTTGGGLIKMENDKQFTQYVDTAEVKGINPGATVVDILEDSKGYLWIGTNRGLYRVDTTTMNFFKLDEEKAFDLLPEDIVYEMELDQDGQLWVGYLASGIFVMDPVRMEIVRKFTRSKELPTNNIVGIEKDAAGRMWIITKRGLLCYLPKQDEFLLFNKKDGLLGDMLETGINYGSDGNMYFGAAGGFHYFNPDSLLNRKAAPTVAISNFQVIDQKKELHQSPIELPYDSNFLAFEFAVLSYSLPEKNKYAYRLNNYEEQWTYTQGADRKAIYRKVPPGTYTFQLRGANYLGHWSDKVFEIPIIIHPPWWQTNWFYLISLLTVIGLAYWWYRIRIGGLKRRERFQKQLAEYEIKALRAQMNPHFIFNSLNSIKLLIQNKQEEEAITYLSKFSKLIRKVLQLSEKQDISLSEELEIAKLYLNMEKLRFEDSFAFDIKIDEQVDPSFVSVPPMIFQPYLENAIWHGLLHLEAGGYLSLRIERREKGWCCIIEDNGIGREKAQVLKSKSATARKSMGLQLSANRLAQHKLINGQEIQLTIIDKKSEHGIAQGTRVEIFFEDHK